MKLSSAKGTDERAIKQLLAQCELPFEDLAAEQLRHFFVGQDGERLLGVVGVEPCGDAALLRSLAVASDLRGQGLGRQLVLRAEEHARSAGAESLWLLTTGAEYFFALLGYEVTDRGAAPEGIQNTTQFASLCPSSSVCMLKRLSTPYVISTEASRMDAGLIHEFLHSSYWAKDIPRAVVEKSLQHSLCFGAFCDGGQVGFARVITDRATFAYLADVFVIPEHRCRGVARKLLRAILDHPELQGLRRLLLATDGAHALYAQFGFQPLAHPEHYMTIHHPDVYRRQPQRKDG
ncbi:MAG: GNAT family N-acetyltransferase [Verrucomicrobia bacterium]|nr:GNAT family N-acetyltransferase [Verrucomicrobiota bacterium]